MGIMNNTQKKMKSGTTCLLINGEKGGMIWNVNGTNAVYSKKEEQASGSLG